MLSVPLRVSGKLANGTPFVEHTKTLIVSAHGALLQLEEPVQDGQDLNIRNVTTGEEMPCQVVDLNRGANAVIEAGIEFSQPNPRFWGVSFPPADWTARSPEAKRFVSNQSTTRHGRKIASSRSSPQRFLAAPPWRLYPYPLFHASFCWAKCADFW